MVRHSKDLHVRFLEAGSQILNVCFGISPLEFQQGQGKKNVPNGAGSKSIHSSHSMFRPAAREIHKQNQQEKDGRSLEGGVRGDINNVSKRGGEMCFAPVFGDTFEQVSRDIIISTFDLGVGRERVTEHSNDSDFLRHRKSQKDGKATHEV